jgi:hypothetical protein
MTNFKSPVWLIVSALVLAVTVWVGNESKLVQAQELDRVLEIERYPNEPLELVSLKIGTQSVKENIKTKFKDNQSKWAIETVKFEEEGDWVKRLSISLRNTSGKPIYGVIGMLILKPLGYPSNFSLQLTHGRKLATEPLQPGAEIQLFVEQKSLDGALEIVKNQGADLRGAVASFSVDMVVFSDELRWYRGNMVRPDPDVPNKWIPVSGPSKQ